MVSAPVFYPYVITADPYASFKTLDLSSLDVSKKTIDQISSDLKKDVNIIWSVKIGGKRYGSETEELTVPAENLGDAALFSVFPEK